MKKKLLCLGIAFLLVGCSRNYMSSLYSNDKEIVSESNSFSVDEETQNIEGQQYSGSLVLEGMDTIWKYDAKEDMNIDISYELSVNKGKAKLVLISPDDACETIVENNEKAEQKELETVTVTLKKGENRIKLVAADKAQIDLDLSVDKGEFNKVGINW
ncbi:hypothetical protein acsn021_03340 [Anaerocolumna cellulosilytica]|uniref:Uncharacterized protein n=1 Tax=Anaerocolumna cellulosilytica TaxID=433286 RepID=A0A6S6QZF8_9FIRM|nr:50S ribosomal protein L7ae [Anaerocolumna cellulosilytica]MBB5197323.1 hypothetical protein [Anaerocolumna cellulosilytica]BCJ92765.1 hypothetical protein acsn021_03340 [Anaerocolumna cellulosilytica]